MRSIFEIARIIHRYLIGEISGNEQILLDKWLEQSKRHPEMLQEFCRKGYLDERILQHQLFRAEKGIQVFMERKKREFWQKRWIQGMVAAVVFGCVVTFSIFWYLNLDHKEPLELVHAENPIVPGSYRAVLILDNGRHVDLLKESELKIKEKSALITVADNHIAYSQEDTGKLEAVNQVFIPRGGEYSLELSDGTIVWLNAESRLRYPVRFKENYREVEITGEAFFEVAKDLDRPFVVDVDGMKISVLGTSFNVRAYPDDVRQATLVKGRIEVSYKNQRVEIAPGEQIELNKGCLEVCEVDTQVCMGWKNGLFVFEEQTLERVFSELERWYDVHVFFESEGVKPLKFTSNIPRYTDIDRVLGIIELAACVKCEIKGHTIIVRLDN